MHISCVVKTGMGVAIDGIGVFRYRQIVGRFEMKLKNPVTALLFDAPLSVVQYYYSDSSLIRLLRRLPR